MQFQIIQIPTDEHRRVEIIYLVSGVYVTFSLYKLMNKKMCRPTATANESRQENERWQKTGWLWVGLPSQQIDSRRATKQIQIDRWLGSGLSRHSHHRSWGGSLMNRQSWRPKLWNSCWLLLMKRIVINESARVLVRKRVIKQGIQWVPFKCQEPNVKKIKWHWSFPLRDQRWL